MKKLISLLTISTLTASIPAPLLANVPLERTKRNIGSLTSNSNKATINDITNLPTDISFITKDNNNRIYFVNNENIYYSDDGNTAIKGKYIPVNGIKGLFFDKNNDIYIVSSLLGPRIWKNNKWDYLGNFRSYENIKGTLIDDYLYFITESKPNAGGINFWKININTKQFTQLNSVNFMPSDIKNFNNNIYFLYQNKLYISNDLGLTIKLLDINVPANSYTFNFDKLNNIYFGTSDGIFVLKQDEKTATKITGINYKVNSLSIYNNYIYFNNKRYFDILSWTKQQSQFTLVDSSKTKTWTRPDLIVVDGELNIDIANPNIDKVVFDNVQQGQTSKHWKINVKPETAAKDYNLQVVFTLDGKQYTSEITVSMLAKINPPTPPVQQNLSDLIKNTDLGNIVDNNDTTIFLAVNKANSEIIDDFSQIEISKKDNHSATLSAKSGSKSYKGTVDVTYNVVPATVVDLKIELKPIVSSAIVDKDYLAQLDNSKMTNKVDTFYYANSESVITMVKPTVSSVITGVVYGCDEQWNKTTQSSTIDPSKGIKLDGSQLVTKDGKYVVELKNELGQTNTIYLQVYRDKRKQAYWNTENGKNFEQWADDNGYKNIRGYSAIQLNNLFAESKNWQTIASDSQFASAVADWFKTNGKLSSKEPLTKEQVVEQLKTQIPSSIKIPAVNTSNYDVNKVSFVLNQSEFNPNDKVNITVKYNSAQSEQFALQIKDSKTPNKKGGLSGLTIVGILLGSLAGVGLVGMLLWRYWLRPWRTKIRNARSDKRVAERRAQWAKEEAEAKAKQKQESGDQNDDGNNS